MDAVVGPNTASGSSVPLTGQIATKSNVSFGLGAVIGASAASGSFVPQPSHLAPDFAALCTKVGFEHF